MERLSPASPEAQARFEAEFAEIERLAGYVPNSMRLMARNPELLGAFMQLTRAVYGPGKVEPRLKSLVAFVSSTAAGCRYCQAHTSSTAHKLGVPEERLLAAFEFDWDRNWTPRERAALRLAAAAGSSPSGVRDEHFEELQRHFSQDEICELAGVIALFGFLNRWNDTLGTALEAAPRSFAEQQLAPRGWSAGSHGR